MKRTEIGSEFWNVSILEEQNSLFYDDTRWFLSGRVALSHIIRDMKNKRNLRTVALPSWCCDSMITPFLYEDVKVEFYPVFIKNGEVVCDITKHINCDAVLVMDYFGFSNTNDYSHFPGIVIRDITHSLFSNKHYDADYYFGSLRKWTGVWTGGFAWSKNGWVTDEPVEHSNDEFIALRQEMMCEKADYINCKTDSKEYLKKLSLAEKILENKPNNQAATKRDVYCARHLNVDEIRLKRRENANAILKELSELVAFSKMSENDCPLFVPILVPADTRDSLRRFLIENEIYCPVHWPKTQFHKLDAETIRIYDEELSIICDQRYSLEDMIRICKLVRDFIGDKEC